MKKLALVIACAGPLLGMAGAAQKPVVDHYAAQATTDAPGFSGFSPDRGKAFFLAERTTGNPDTRSCSACHTADPKDAGETRAGKRIAPMAVSVTPDRFTDLAKVEKWFRRNCDTVMGRECTAAEKGDFITFMTTQ